MEIPCVQCEAVEALLSEWSANNDKHPGTFEDLLRHATAPDGAIDVNKLPEEIV